MTREKFEQVVLPESRNLYRFAFRFLRNAEEAEDAIQEVFIKLWRLKDKLDSYDNVKAFAMTITRNHCLDLLRKKKFILNEDTRTVDTGADGMTPQHVMESNETIRDITRIILELPDRYSKVMQLRDLEGLEYDEIEKQLGLSTNNLRVNLSRARKMVREQLKLTANGIQGSERIA